MTGFKTFSMFSKTEQLEDELKMRRNISYIYICFFFLLKHDAYFRFLFFFLQNY